MYNNQKYCQLCDEPVRPEKVPACPLQCRSQKCKAYQVKDPVNLENKPIIWVLGGPGSGKGTQSKMLVAKYGFAHFSTGDLLEEEIKSRSPCARCLITVKTRGALAPNDLVLNLLKTAIDKRAAGANGIIIDGYPRERAQGVLFEQQIAPATVILFLDATEETLIKRLAGRGHQSDRVDDHQSSVLMRLRTFRDNSEQVLSFYSSKIVMVDANRTTDEVFADIVKIIDPIVQAQAAQAQQGATTQQTPK